jgi:hypothetical protein
MVSIKINDIFVELKEENENLRNELLIKNELLSHLLNECKCETKINLLNEKKFKQIIEKFIEKNDHFIEEEMVQNFGEEEEEDERKDLNKLLKCPFIGCHEMYLSRRALRSHQKKHNFENENKNNNRGEDPDWDPNEDLFITEYWPSFKTKEEYKKRCQKYKCSYSLCSFRSDKKKRLEIHLKKHSINSFKICEEMGCQSKYFKTQNELIAHKLNEHNINDEKYLRICEETNCSYRTKGFHYLIVNYINCIID